MTPTAALPSRRSKAKRQAAPAPALFPPPAQTGSWKWAASLFCCALGTWAYWPTLVEVVGTWWREPDYSHGFLVVPLAIAFLWIRRSGVPDDRTPAHLLGL